jgi:hypothetical protein
VILEEAPAGPRLTSPSPAVAERVDIAHYSAHRVTVRVHLEAPGLLVLGDTYYPHWTATVDGEPARVHRANYLFRAVPVPAGTHVVEFVYRPRHFYAALGVSALAMVAGLILIWSGGRSAATAEGETRQTRRGSAPADTRPADTRPADIRPADTRSADTRSPDTHPSGTRPSDTA